MKQMGFFYFFGSAYAYLSVMRIASLAKTHGVDVRWRPFNVRTVMAENNIALRTQHAKVGYMWNDIARRAAVHGVAFKSEPPWPTDPNLLANLVGVVASDQGWLEPYTVASFKSWVLEGKPLGEPESLAGIIAAQGRDPEAVIGEAQSARAAKRLENETDAARRAGIFGSPSFVVGDQMFWGDDRLDEAMQWAAGRHPRQLGLA